MGAALLTDRQQLFVDEYLKDFKPTAAAERAGYSSPPWGDEVKAAVDEGVRNRRELLGIDGAMVLRELARCAFHEIDFDDMKPADKIKALELLGKNLKLFTERFEVSAVEGLAEKLAEARARLENLPLLEGDVQ